MRVFVTGAAGFIGFHLCQRLLADGHTVTGLDGLTAYYDPALKLARLGILNGIPGFWFIHAMLDAAKTLKRSVSEFAPDIVVHLAAQPGVRYGMENPQSYVDANISGTFNLLEIVRGLPLKHLLIGSTSAVYGGNTRQPFAETDRTDFPISIYASTKKAAEAISHSHAHLYGVPTTCLRFFTVYGPWGRPDMALFKFVEAIESGRPIEIYGNGEMERDFTYVDDLVEAVCRLMPLPPKPGEAVSAQDSVSAVAPWRAVNIAGGKPVKLLDFVSVIELALGKPAARLVLPGQPGDVRGTEADTRLLRDLTGFVPQTTLEEGVKAFVTWYRQRRSA